MAVINRARGCAVNCLVMSLPKSVSAAARVTMIPVAVEINSAGTWVTMPSPTVNSVNFCSDSMIERCCCATPTMKPPTVLIATMITAATASPRTNLLAPSIAP